MASSGAGAVSRVSGVLLAFRAVFLSTTFLQFVVVDVCILVRVILLLMFLAWRCLWLSPKVDTKGIREQVQGLPCALKKCSLGSLEKGFPEDFVQLIPVVTFFTSALCE